MIMLFVPAMGRFGGNLECGSRRRSAIMMRVPAVGFYACNEIVVAKVKQE